MWIINDHFFGFCEHMMETLQLTEPRDPLALPIHTLTLTIESVGSGVEACRDARVSLPKTNRYSKVSLTWQSVP